ncbi:hypothetical protein ACFL0T_08175, partial [Candidatus Omnitrophota bacterium]
MLRNTKLTKVVSILISTLFIINNISFAAEDAANFLLQKESALREMSSGTGGATPALLEGALSQREAFPVKMLGEKKGSIDMSKEPDHAQVLGSLEITLDPMKDDGSLSMGPLAVNDEADRDLADTATALLLFGGSKFSDKNNELLRASKGASSFIDGRSMSGIFSKPVTVQIVKDNDKLVDVAPVSFDVESPEVAIRIDSDIIEALDIKMDGGRLKSGLGDHIRDGVAMLYSMSLLHSMLILQGKSQRDALHDVVDYYLSFTKDEKDSLRTVLRTDKIDSGNAFNIFLHAITDVELAAEIEESKDFDMSAHVSTRSADLAKGIQLRDHILLDIRLDDTDQALLDSVIAAADAKEAEDRSIFEKICIKVETARSLTQEDKEYLEKEIEDMRDTYKWRDKQISWLMLLEKIDIPYDYEEVAKIMSDGRRRAEEGTLNVDEWHAQLHEAIAKTYNKEVEDANIFRVAKYCNQNDIQILVGRLGRAFENQARKTSDARLVIIRPELQEAAQALRDLVFSIDADKDEAKLSNELVNLRVTAEELLGLSTQTTIPSFVEIDVAITNFREAAAEYQRVEIKELDEEKDRYQRQPMATPARVKWYDGLIEAVNGNVASIREQLAEAKGLLVGSDTRNAAYVFLIQRIFPPETHKLAKGITNRDVDAGKEEDIRDLLRTGGHLAYVTPGDGAQYSPISFADHIVEAIPMLVMERIIEHDGVQMTQAEVDQKGMEEFFRNVFSPNFLKDIQNYLDTNYIQMAREILFATPQYADSVKRYEELPFPEFMKALLKAHPDLPVHIASIAAMIDQSYGDLLKEVLEYQSKNGCDRITAIRDVIVGDDRDTSNKNLVHSFLSKMKSWDNVADNIQKVNHEVLGRSKDADTALSVKHNRVKPFWDWKARKRPTFHDLTTQAPGLTEGYIQTWIEEEMTLIKILENNEALSNEVRAKTGDYTKRLVACTKKVLDEYGMMPDVETVMLERGFPEEARDKAILDMLTIYPFLAKEVAKLAVLIEDSEHEKAKATDKSWEEVRDLDNAQDVRDIDKYVQAHMSDTDFLGKVINEVVALHGITLQNEINKYAADQAALGHEVMYGDAAQAVIKADETYLDDFNNQLRFVARQDILEELDKEAPEKMILEQVSRFVRSHTKLSISTARKEIIAKHHLQHLMADPRYHPSSEGLKKMYNLLYTPSRVNLGYKELWSITGWSQAIGAKDAEAAAAGYDFYRLINAHPVIYMSPKIAEALKAAENGSMQQQLAFTGAISMLIDYLGDGDVQELFDEMMSRGDRVLHMATEGYGGYCVPKDGLFLAFVVALSQEHKLGDMGVDPRFHGFVMYLAKKLLAKKPELNNDFAWEMWTAKEFLAPEKLNQHFKDYLEQADQDIEAADGDFDAISAEFAKYVRLGKSENTGDQLLVFNINNLANIIATVGKPDVGIASGSKLLSAELAEWSLGSQIIQSERTNRMMPLIKAWKILRDNPDQVNLSAEYKKITGEMANVADVRFATGIRIFEFLTGCCDHLIRQFDPEGQHIARLMRFGFDPKSEDEDVKKAAIWYMKKNNIDPNDTMTINRLKKEMPYYEPPKDIILTATSGVAVDDIFTYTSDRQVKMDDIATRVHEQLAEMGISDDQIAAFSDIYGAEISQWPIIKDHPDLQKTLNMKIDVKGADNEIYSYPFKTAIHYLALKQRTIARDYKKGLQGCDAVNLGVVSGEMEEILHRYPELIAYMLNGRPDEEPKLYDGSPGRADTVSRAYMDMDVELFFATCENWGLANGEFANEERFGKLGKYVANGVGPEKADRLRGRMRAHRNRALELYNALLAVKAAKDGAPKDKATEKAKAILAIIEQEISHTNEAKFARKHEQMLIRFKKHLPRDAWFSRSLSKLSSGMPLEYMNTGIWLAMGGMHLLAGRNAGEIEEILTNINEALGEVSATGLADVDKKYAKLQMSDDDINKCSASFMHPAYEPEVGAFKQETLVEISSKAMEAASSQARARKLAIEKRGAVS